MVKLLACDIMCKLFYSLLMSQVADIRDFRLFSQHRNVTLTVNVYFMYIFIYSFEYIVVNM